MTKGAGSDRRTVRWVTNETLLNAVRDRRTANPTEWRACPATRPPA